MKLFVKDCDQGFSVESDESLNVEQMKILEAMYNKHLEAKLKSYKTVKAETTKRIELCKDFGLSLIERDYRNDYWESKFEKDTEALATGSSTDDGWGPSPEVKKIMDENKSNN